MHQCAWPELLQASRVAGLEISTSNPGARSGGLSQPRAKGRMEKGEGLCQLQAGEKGRKGCGFPSRGKELHPCTALSVWAATAQENRVRSVNVNCWAGEIQL